MASELGRVAHAAFRSASLLRPSAPRAQFVAKPVIAACQRHGPTSPVLRSLGALLPTQQQHSFSSSNNSSNNWTSPYKEQWPAEPEIEVKKPQTSLYYNKNLSEAPFEMDFDLDLGDLKRKKEVDTTSEPTVPKPTMRLVPRLGRTVNVSKNVDVARSFKLLAIQINQNKIRSDFQSQRFHERPGLKRKRLRCERWVRRFKKGFKETAMRVRELTKQGW